MGFSAQWTYRKRVVDEMMKAAIIASSGNTIDLALGDPDLNTDARVIQAAFDDAERGHTHYAPARGDNDLLQAIQETWSQDLGVALNEEELMVSASGSHAMWLLLMSILDPEDEVIIFSPYFSPYPEQILLAKGTPVEVSTSASNGFTPTADALKDAITPKTKAVIVNSPCNPTGKILNKHEIESLLEVCIAHKILYIADDIYTAFDFEQPFVAAACCDCAKGNVATIRSFSKDFCMSGWRVGYVVAPKDVISTMLSINESNVYVAPTISQRAAYHALELRDEISRSVRETYKERMEYVVSRIATIPYLTLPSSQGGLYAFIDISKSAETSSSFTYKLLKKYGVSVIAGTAFGKAGEGFIRMALRENTRVLAKVFDALASDPEWGAHSAL